MAILRLRHVVETLPVPAYVIMLGDILRAAGRANQAAREYALVGPIEKLLAANGVRTELQTALFDLDHRRHVADALAGPEPPTLPRRASTPRTRSPGASSELAGARRRGRTPPVR